MPKGNKPYRVQPIFQSLLARLSLDEFLHDLQLRLTTRLESAGVVENIAIMSFENDFVIDMMEATLQPRSSVMISRPQYEDACPTSVEGSS